MKLQRIFFSVVLVTSLLFVSCKEESPKTKTYLVAFENVALGSENFWDGSDLSGDLKEEDSPWVPGAKDKNYYGGFTDGVATFKNKYTPNDWGGSWIGFACSAKNDTKTPGRENQYSTIAGSGANASAKFALAFDQNATFECPKNEYGYLSIESIMLTNSTYAYYSIKDGDGYAKKFAAGEWFKVTITGYKGDKETQSVDYYLADFREGKTFISDSWVKVDVSALGEVDNVRFTFDSSDEGQYGLNTPLYVCVDNIMFKQDI